MKINRRELLALAAGSAAAMAWPSVSAATPDWQDVVPQKPYQPYVFPFERTLVLSDMREVMQYSIDSNRFLLRYDVAWSRDHKGRKRQMNCVMDAPTDVEALSFLRGVTLRQFQRKFDADKRIRANLIPLAQPHGAPDYRPEWWVAL